MDLTTADRFHGYIAALESLAPADRSRPVALLDLDAFDANAADLVRRASGTPVRVASKSLRIRRAIERAEATEGFHGIMAFTLPEALWLAEEGHTEILLAYPTMDRHALTVLAGSPEARQAITLMVDSDDHLDAIAEACTAAGLPASEAEAAPLSVCIELDVSWCPSRPLHIGAYRSPVFEIEDALHLGRRILQTPGLRLRGMMGYEGQIAGVHEGGAVRGKIIRAMKKVSLRELAPRRRETAAALRELAAEHGQQIDIVNGGGTGSIEDTVASGGVTEVAAGSGLMGSGLFDLYHHFQPRPAAHFVFDVVRRPTPEVATILGGGWIASGPAGQDRLPTIAWPEGLRYALQEGPGEVQTPLMGDAAASLRPGDPVFLRHAKSGEPFERVNRVHVYSQGEIIDTWPTYRGEGKAFL